MATAASDGQLARVTRSTSSGKKEVRPNSPFDPVSFTHVWSNQ